ncbi:MAG: hypothetical protein ACXVHX_02290 [Solirubrobacteraceae bacterium]
MDLDGYESEDEFLANYEREYGTDEEPARSRPPGPVNWNLLDADEAQEEWLDLDLWVYWLRTTFGLSPTILPPYWHRHDELIWELSALHVHFLACFEDTAPPSGPITWMREFAEARHRLRDWVAQCGTRLDRDRPTRQTIWPGEHAQPQGGEVEIVDRAADFADFVGDDVARRRRLEDDVRGATRT